RPGPRHRPVHGRGLPDRHRGRHRRQAAPVGERPRHHRGVPAAPVRGRGAGGDDGADPSVRRRGRSAGRRGGARGGGPAMSGTNLAEILEARACDRGRSVGLYAEDGRSWTFAQIDRVAGGVAEALAAAGIGAGDRVGLYLVNGPEIAFFLFGAWKLGAVPVTISSLYNAAELAESVEKTDPKLLLVDVRRSDVLAELDADVTIRSVEPLGETGGSVAGAAPLEWGGEAEVRAVQVAADAESCILFTGGTTGRPKA